MEQILVDNKHEYNYKLEDNYHKLYYSDNGDWTFPNQISLIITDDGNGLAVSTEDESIVYLDYSTAEKLLILLKLINRETIYEVVTKKQRI